MQESQSKKNSLVDRLNAIDTVVNANNPVILDFDESLLLRNSTAEYINSLRPRLIGFLLIIFLKIIRPWVWLPQPFGGDKTRDWFLVTVPTILLPWNLLLWPQKAKNLADKYRNSELISAVECNSDATIIVASLGFNFIIEPILQHLPMRFDLLVSCRFWQGASDRHKGKLLMMQEVISDSDITSAVLVTDSEDDLPLLQVVEHPCFVLWSEAKYIEPFKDFWLYSWLKSLKS
jgi:hypothetical protein